MKIKVLSLITHSLKGSISWEIICLWGVTFCRPQLFPFNKTPWYPVLIDNHGNIQSLISQISFPDSITKLFIQTFSRRSRLQQRFGNLSGLIASIWLGSEFWETSKGKIISDAVKSSYSHVDLWKQIPEFEFTCEIFNQNEIELLHAWLYMEIQPILSPLMFKEVLKEKHATYVIRGKLNPDDLERKLSTIQDFKQLVKGKKHKKNQSSLNQSILRNLLTGKSSPNASPKSNSSNSSPINSPKTSPRNSPITTLAGTPQSSLNTTPIGTPQGSPKNSSILPLSESPRSILFSYPEVTQENPTSLEQLESVNLDPKSKKLLMLD